MYFLLLNVDNIYWSLLIPLNSVIEVNQYIVMSPVELFS